MLDFKSLAEAKGAAEPFPHLVCAQALSPADVAAANADFPVITRPGLFPFNQLHYGLGFGRLIDEIRGPRLRRLLEDRFDIDLSDKPLMVTVRGLCARRDGRIHTDSKDKIVTGLLYLNAEPWAAAGGRLRLLRDGRNLDNMIAEVPPDGGSLVAFRRTDNAWHGHAPYEGPRRYIMFNWLRSDAAMAINAGRHTLSAAAKRLGLFHAS
jgi:hypothetical protein